MNDQSDQNPSDAQDIDDVGTTSTESAPRMTTRLKTAVGVSSAALLAFGLMLAGQVGDPLFFRSPDPDPAVAVAIEEASKPQQTDLILEAGAEDAVELGETGDDVLPGESRNDLLRDELVSDHLLAGEPGSDDLFGRSNDALATDESNTQVYVFVSEDDVFPSSNALVSMPGLLSLCPSVAHGESSSHIWLEGEVAGVGNGWLLAEGPTINGGQFVEMPVTDGKFAGPLPVTFYAGHEITRLEFGAPDIVEPLDLWPTLADGPGAVFPVGPDEGPIFEQECFEFAPNEVTATTEIVDDPAVTDALIDDPVTDLDEAMFEQQRLTEEADRMLNDFVQGFVEDHRTGNAEGLQTTLHPSIRLAYGDDVCSGYIDRTTGSITAATIINVGPPQPLDMNTPSGQINFPEAIPFTVEFEVIDGSTFVNDAHLPIHDGEAQWLTSCGVEAP